MLELSELDIRAVVDELIRKRLVVNTAGFNARVPRYQHRFCNTEFGELKFSAQELGIVCELLLRGPQTPGSCARAPTDSAASMMSPRWMRC